jgi:hypothetical protein
MWEFGKATLDAPRSSLRASGVISQDSPGKTRLRFLSSSIHLDDLLAWYRAFHGGVADGVAVDGYLGVDVEAAGWPPAIERGVLATDGARIIVPGISKPCLVSHASFRATPQSSELSPMIFTFGESGDSFRLTAKSPPAPSTVWQAAVSGATRHAEELFAGAVALGLKNEQAWRVRGALSANLHWQGTRRPWSSAATGTVDLEDVDLLSGALALPVHVPHAHIEMAAGERRIHFSAAQFLGGEWAGSVRARTPAGPWEFNVEAGHLDTAEFGRWFHSSAAAELADGTAVGAGRDAVKFAWPETFAANGRLTVGDLDVGRLKLKKLKAAVSIADHNIELSPGEAEFFGGKVRGSFRAALEGAPLYDVDAKFERVDLGALASVGRTFGDCCSGKISAAIQLTAKGVGHDDLLKSLKGEGTANIQGAELRTLDLAQSREAGASREGGTSFRTVTAHFTIDAPEIFFDTLRLDYGGESDLVTGFVSFNDALRLALHHLDSSAGDNSAATFERVFRITGSLGAPQLAPIPLAEKPR